MRAPSRREGSAVPMEHGRALPARHLGVRLPPRVSRYTAVPSPGHWSLGAKGRVRDRAASTTLGSLQPEGRGWVATGTRASVGSGLRCWRWPPGSLRRSEPSPGGHPVSSTSPHRAHSHQAPGRGSEQDPSLHISGEVRRLR